MLFAPRAQLEVCAAVLPSRNACCVDSRINKAPFFLFFPGTANLSMAARLASVFVWVGFGLALAFALTREPHVHVRKGPGRRRGVNHTIVGPGNEKNAPHLLRCE